MGAVNRLLPVLYLATHVNGFKQISNFHKMDVASYHLRRLIGVKGDGEKQNDVIVCSKAPTSPKLAKEHVIFFGGDVQDYPEKMQQHRDNYRYEEWNLEETARLLTRRFSDSMVMVVKPAQMFLNTFSIFSNFVDFPDNTVPVLKAEYDGLLHMSKLYENVLQKMSEYDSPAVSQTDVVTQSDVKPGDARLFPSSDNIVLVGFSKGCVVLNQFLYELQKAESDPVLKQFLSKIKAIYWLDGGHKGIKDTWVTDHNVLKRLVELNIPLFAHVTPYQVQDPMREWIGKEHSKFVTRVKKFGGNITDSRHFFDEPPTIENHFCVLKAF